MNDKSTCSCKRTFNKYFENWYFIKPVTVLKKKNFLIELLDAMSNNNGQGFFTTTMNILEVLFPDLFVDKNA